MGCKLLGYDFEIHYKLRKENRGVDMLSGVGEGGEFCRVLPLTWYEKIRNNRVWKFTMMKN